jgi:chromosomal replication initiation ATPase DnaA
MSATEWTPEELDARLAVRPALPPEAPAFDPAAVARDIARAHGVTVDELLGPLRVAHIVRARKELYATLRARGWSYPAIGNFVGGRDHSTVMAGLGKAKGARKQVAA